MSYEDRNRTSWPQWEVDETKGALAQPLVSPGKRTLTMSLPPRSSSLLASAQTPVQQETDPKVVMQRKEQAALTKQWMDVALRPDLHEPPVQYKGAGDESEHEARVQPAGSGKPMPADVQVKMEGAFGTDFSAVRIHEGSQATAMGALAYTQGTDIHFAPGQYNPGSQRGQELLGHELTHVVQQSQGRVQATTQAKGTPINSDPSLEREADERGAVAAQSDAAPTPVLDGGKASLPMPADAAAQPVQRNPDAATAEGRVDTEPTWSGQEVRAIQRELQRLGLYHLGIDGDLGNGSKAALVEAFGNDDWRTLSASDVLTRLRGAQTPTDRGDRFHYGQMFRDGILDITLGVGFDEGDNHLAAIDGFQRVLGARGFRLDAARAEQLYTQAGRQVQASDFGQFYVLENALTYTPPVGGASRPIHAVVRLLFSRDGSQGGEASQAFRQGMAQSDVAYYSGHGRYGSGPDFDRNMEFELLDPDGNVERQIQDYTVLERELAREGRSSGRSAWQQFLWRSRNDRINVIGSNEGNVFLNPTNHHGGEFGARLMYWNLERQGGEGAAVHTGRGGEMQQELQSPQARQYTVTVFDGCRTQDYTPSIRNTPGVNRHNRDILATRRTVDWGDEVNTLAAFLDGIIAQQNKAEIIEALDNQQGGAPASGTYRDQ